MTKFWLLCFLIVLFWLTDSRSAQALTGRYILIELPGTNRILSLTEVSVFSGSSNIALQGKARQSSTFRQARAQRAVDGYSDGHYFHGSVSSTSSQSNPWWELDLGSEQPITKIIVHNRTDCCSDRINPAHVQILDKSKRVVWSGAIRTTKTRYEFTMTGASTKSGVIRSSNLLRNSTFQQRTNHSIPDYWDLHHVAALTFENLHEQYGIDDNAESPVPGTKVLRIQNTEENFSHVIVIPHKFFYSLPDGEYTFSVYLRAEKDGMGYRVTRAWAEGEQINHKLTAAWARYSATFRLSGKTASMLNPVMFFPSKGTYYVAAPQLERGSTAGPFQASPTDESQERAAPSLEDQLKSLKKPLNGVLSAGHLPSMSAAFEYDYYTNQQTAILTLTSRQETEQKGSIRCADAEHSPRSIFVQNNIVLQPFSSTVLNMPIADLPAGTYYCRFETLQTSDSQSPVETPLVKLPPGRMEVRVNNQRRFISIDNKPFHVIGMAVSSSKIPPDWYFKDLADHGINTVFYTRPPNRRGEYDVREVEAFIAGAARHDLKVIVGQALAGAKVSDWRQRITGFIDLMARLKDNPAVIGWYPVDEPAAHTWQDQELLEIYQTVKNTDPYRLVFVNWAYDGIPPQIGQEPRGTLASTDVYSIDYYPFAGQGRSIGGFTTTTVRALETARIRGKVPHSWIQLYGLIDAWREPTSDEIRHMVYVNLLYGGTISYWDTKSNSRKTWERLSEINREAQMLAEALLHQADAKEIVPPTVQGNFFHSVWKKGNQLFLLVTHHGSVREEFIFDPSPVTDGRIVGASRFFTNQGLVLLAGKIQESFDPFDSRTYVVELQ